MSSVRIRAQRPWIGYPGSTVQQNYAEDVRHGFLLWEIENRDSFDVRFCELPNPHPFITIEWLGSVEATAAAARVHPPASRFRVRHRDVLTQKDVAQLTATLRNELRAIEVTLKSEHQANRDVVSTGAATIAKDDLRNPDILMRLLRDYHREMCLTDDEWAGVKLQVSTYLQQALDGDDVVRNTKWSLRHLAFDNTFNYGTGNVVSFEQMQGVVGIFGPNRAGKSSIIGTMLYALFNTTDRGNLKNLHVVNVRQPYCYTRSVVNVNSTNYVIERQTAKYETKRGQVYAGTALNFFQVGPSGELVDLVGEQRNDTEKMIRKLLGAPEDCLMTSVAAQDDVKMFINQGTTKRRKDLSRFLDLDIFDKMYELAKLDVNTSKGALRQLPDRDWPTLEADYARQLANLSTKIEEGEHLLHDISLQLHAVRSQLSAFNDFAPVTQPQVDQQRLRVASLKAAAGGVETELEALHQQHAERTTRLSRIDDVLVDNDLTTLRRQAEAARALESALGSLRHASERDAELLKQQERSLKILDEVPCGDSFPTCKFIRDAFKHKERVEPQRERVQRSLERVQKAEAALAEAGLPDLSERVSKVEKIQGLKSSLSNELVRLEALKERKEHDLDVAIAKVADAVRRLGGLEEALKNEENVEIVELRDRMGELERSARRLTVDRLTHAAEVGRIESDCAKAGADKRRRHDLLQLMKAHELIAQAFSRKGIPSLIVASQLPVINAEVAKILGGIVNFTVELEQDDDSDSMEVYIDYGDSRRIIELASGMEKTIASIAIRVALINVTSLPKTDMFVIDEAFGPLDPAGVEACNRLLTSLKRCFKTIIVITHVEGVKDVADHVIEVSNIEKDAHVVYDETWPNDRTAKTA